MVLDAALTKGDSDPAKAVEKVPFRVNMIGFLIYINININICRERERLYIFMCV